MLNRIKRYGIIFLTTNLFVSGLCGKVLAWPGSLPEDFIETVSKIYRIPYEFKFSSGGAEARNAETLSHYPVIMIHGNRHDSADWFGLNNGNSEGPDDNVYERFLKAGFAPDEIWLYQYTTAGHEMRSIEDLTDGLKWFIYSALWYTRSDKVQILAHGEGAVLAHATLKKYNLYNLVHASVYIAAPFHGSERYTLSKALAGYPVCANLAVDSDFLKDLILPDETPFNSAEEEDNSHSRVKYMTIYNGLPYADEFFFGYPDSPSLMGAANHSLDYLDHDGLRCSPRASDLFIPFLSDAAFRYDASFDSDNDGFMSAEVGGVDCDDGDAGIFPGAQEVPQDNIDQDCNYMDLVGVDGKDRLVPIK
ncbi:MAG: hypothetical protein JW800_00675 [Candidatus Omnitrophica bacterium]|nr:hypothetical protein [Candidatus Omnitrophota bacterium]